MKAFLIIAALFSAVSSPSAHAGTYAFRGLYLDISTGRKVPAKLTVSFDGHNGTATLAAPGASCLMHLGPAAEARHFILFDTSSFYLEYWSNRNWSSKGFEPCRTSNEADVEVNVTIDESGRATRAQIVETWRSGSMGPHGHRSNHHVDRFDSAWAAEFND